MWESKMFTENQMVAWENKPAVNQTWVNLQTYFTEKWLERRQYLAATAKQSRFKAAALAAQEQAAATEEGDTQAMMFAMLQEQHQLLEENARANPNARIRPLTHVSVDQAYQAESVGSNSLLSYLIAICHSPNL